MRRITHHRARRCHRVEFVEHPVDGGSASTLVSDVIADQVTGPAHRFIAEVRTQLPDQLSAQQLNLLLALNLDPFYLDIRLNP